MLQPQSRWLGCDPKANYPGDNPDSAPLAPLGPCCSGLGRPPALLTTATGVTGEPVQGSCSQGTGRGGDLTPVVPSLLWTHKLWRPGFLQARNLWRFPGFLSSTVACRCVQNDGPQTIQELWEETTQEGIQM